MASSANRYSSFLLTPFLVAYVGRKVSIVFRQIVYNVKASGLLAGGCEGLKGVSSEPYELF